MTHPIDWTPETRLHLIRILAKKQITEPPINRQWMRHAQAIIFLCDRPADFLERNRRNFADEIAQMLEEQEVDPT